MSTFSENLKNLRVNKGLSVKEMATKLEVAPSTYREWEYGRKIQGEPYPKIAEILNVSLDKLFGRKQIKVKDVLNSLEEIKNKIDEVEKAVESFF